MMDTAAIDAARNHILQKYHMRPEALLSRGMEAEVYAYSPEAVLKLYAGTANLADLRTLKDFYDSLDRPRVPYALPRIELVAQEEGCLITIEQRLAGTRMSAVLPSLTAGQLDEVMRCTLTATRAVARLQAPPGFDRYKLFDPDRVSQRASGDWHQFVGRYLTHKLAQVSPYLNRDVSRFGAKVQQLRAIIDQSYAGSNSLIHGDLVPANLLINPDHQITAVLDFGLFTMYGDDLFDIATGWVLFDMYDKLKAKARERYLALILEQLGESVRGKLYRYVLMYSILSANAYSSNCTDGHYQWCVANLRHAHYWQAVE